MLFCSYSKVNKLVLLRYKLHPVPLRLLKTALVNLAKRSTVLLCALVIHKKVKVINKPYKVYFKVWLISYTKKLLVIK
jgi:hypothetical protein